MDSMLKKLMEKKKPSEMDDSYKSAKMGVLKELHKSMGGMMGEDLKGLKKVTVAAPDKSGLKLGLEKAEDMLSSEAPEMESLEGSEESEDESVEDMQEMPKTLEEVEAKILELEALKAKLSMEAE